MAHSDKIRQMIRTENLDSTVLRRKSGSWITAIRSQTFPSDKSVRQCPRDWEPIRSVMKIKLTLVVARLNINEASAMIKSWITFCSLSRPRKHVAYNFSCYTSEKSRVQVCYTVKSCFFIEPSLSRYFRLKLSDKSNQKHFSLNLFHYNFTPNISNSQFLKTLFAVSLRGSRNR